MHDIFLIDTHGPMHLAEIDRILYVLPHFHSAHWFVAQSRRGALQHQPGAEAFR